MGRGDTIEALNPAWRLSRAVLDPSSLTKHHERRGWLDARVGDQSNALLVVVVLTLIVVVTLVVVVLRVGGR